MSLEKRRSPGNSKGCMMSSAQHQTTLGSKLEVLECHFTWDLDPSRSELLHLRDKLEDIGTEEGYNWLGHIYNLQGFIHHQLGLEEDALRFFSRAAEALRQIRNTVSDEGPWLVVNYGNLAWLHLHLGEQAESQAYLLKVDALLNEYPSPSPDEPHPEICAEKAWTLMKFGTNNKMQAVGYFQRAIRMKPDMVEWHTSNTLALVGAYKHRLEVDVFEKMKIAKEHDPENLYLTALYLEQCARRGQKIKDEVRKLARRVLRKPVSSYSGIKPILKFYRSYISMDEAIDLAEEALERHPDERYLKRCAAICYKWRVLLHGDNPPVQSVMDRAIGLYQEVIALYPQSTLKRKITLANIYAESSHGQAKADQIFQELLEGEQEPADRQMLYCCYAKHAHAVQKQSYKSIEFHMKAVAIRHQSVYRANSIRILEKIKERNRNKMCGEIEEFLAKLQD
ncbi:interferon-induced protein with tetratricopeptide repeats 1-like [Aulostomus maculatus]